MSDSSHIKSYQPLQLWEVATYIEQSIQILECKVPMLCNRNIHFMKMIRLLSSSIKESFMCHGH